MHAFPALTLSLPRRRSKDRWKRELFFARVTLATIAPASPSAAEGHRDKQYTSLTPAFL